MVTQRKTTKRATRNKEGEGSGKGDEEVGLYF
jgi:hypothetical protein